MSKVPSLTAFERRLQAEMIWLVSMWEARQMRVTRRLAKVAAIAFTRAVKEALEVRGRSGALRIPGLGTFRRTRRKARRVHNPAVDSRMNVAVFGEDEQRPAAVLDLPETFSVRFSPCKDWRKELNRGAK